MRHPTRWNALAAGVVVMLLVVVLVMIVGDEAGSGGGRLVGHSAPAFDLRTLDGARVTGAGLDGRAYVVNFWNSWCVPCRQEGPALAAFYERHSDEPDFKMIGIVRDDTERAVRDYVEAEGIAWTVALDPGGRAALDFGTTGQPETFVVGPDGLVTGAQIGPVTDAQLEEMLALARGGGGV